MAKGSGGVRGGGASRGPDANPGAAPSPAAAGQALAGPLKGLPQQVGDYATFERWMDQFDRRLGALESRQGGAAPPEYRRINTQLRALYNQREAFEAAHESFGKRFWSANPWGPEWDNA